jgi:pilus assembly protein CpaE
MSDRVETKRQTLSARLRDPESISMKTLSIVVLGSDEQRRRTLVDALTGTQARIVKETALPGLDALPSVLEGECDVLIVDLNGDPERGLDLVEAACRLDSAITVMVYSRQTDPELVVRSMRAGAREFLNDPLSKNSIAEALVRASARREEVQGQKKTRGKALVFVGAKGGSGVTTLASNFAVSLAKESGQSVALLDLNLQLGDAALTLGVSSEFSTLDALQNESRLDSDLVSKLLVRHSSGLYVMAAPDEHNTFQPTAAGVMKLVNILRSDFAWVVVDAGCHFSGYAQSLFDSAEKVYLVTQVNVVELRNSHRLIDALFEGEARRKLEVILNRFAARVNEIDEPGIAKALMVPLNWKVPSDFQAIRSAQNEATALVLKNGAVTRVLTSMAKAACGKAPDEIKKRRFGLFN